MFLDGCEVVVQVLNRVTLKLVQSVCEADKRGGSTLTVSSIAFARMTVYAGRTVEWTDDDGCGPVVQRSNRGANRSLNSQ